jgi:hypothetical protein
MCEIKSKIYTISEILESKETVSKDFNTENITETSSSSIINLMKCYNTVFSKLGLLKNLGNYILLLYSFCLSHNVIFVPSSEVEATFIIIIITIWIMF